jgi:hypothetical protein
MVTQKQIKEAAEKYIKAFLVFNEMMPPKGAEQKGLIEIPVKFDASFETMRS